MPIVEYSCSKCGYRFKIREASDDCCSCPSCGASDATKVVAGFSEEARSTAESCYSGG